MPEQKYYLITAQWYGKPARNILSDKHPAEWLKEAKEEVDASNKKMPIHPAIPYLQAPVILFWGDITQEQFKALGGTEE